MFVLRRTQSAPRDGPTGTARRLSAAILVLLLGACAARPVAPPDPPTLRDAGPAFAVPEMDVLAMSPEMQAFLERYVLPYEDLDMRLDLLSLALSKAGMLGFHYADERSFTASEAFANRAGNCLSFANMLVALARASGLEARFQEVKMQPRWSSYDDTILLTKHVNVFLGGERFAYVIDVTGQRPEPDARTRFLTDEEAKALFLNNLAVDALLDNQLAPAWAYTARAIEIAPALASPWVNLGVVLKRNGQLHDAITAQRAALDIDPGETAALSNLYDAYRGVGDTASAQHVWARVEAYRKRNPYYLMKLSDEALAETRYRDSLDLMEKAVRRKDDDHQLQFALARAQYLNGEVEAAEMSYARARQLAPEPVLAQYAKPLGELISENPPGR